MPFSCAELSTKTKGMLCDPLWSLCLDEDYDDETLNDTVAGDTLGGSSHLVDVPERTRKLSSKKQTMKKRQSPSLVSSTDGDKVMEYFLGSGGASDEDGERAKQTFRRRKKKLQQTQSPQKVEESTSPEKSRSTKIELPPQLEQDPNVPTKVISLVQKKSTDKYSPVENREDGDCVSFDSRSTLTTPTVQSVRENPAESYLPVPKKGQPIAETTTDHSNPKGSSAKVPAVQETQTVSKSRDEKGSTSQKEKASTSGRKQSISATKINQSRGVETPSRLPTKKEKGSASKSRDTSTLRRDEKISEASREKPSVSRSTNGPSSRWGKESVSRSANGTTSRKEKTTKSRLGGGFVSRGEKAPVSRSGEFVSSRREKAPLSRSGDVPKRNGSVAAPFSKSRVSEIRDDYGRNPSMGRPGVYDRPHGFDEPQREIEYPPHYYPQRERELRNVANVDKQRSGPMTRERTIDRPPRTPDAWVASSPTTKRPMMLLKIPTMGRNRHTSAGGRRVAEDPPRSKSPHVPHVISDISRRELELRSIGLYGPPTTTLTSTPRYGGREGEYRYETSNQRDLGYSSRIGNQSEHDTYHAMYGRNSRSPSRDSHGFVDLTTYDDYDGMPASMKLELGARVARKQIENSIATHGQSSRFRAQRSVSVPQQRQDYDVEENIPNLLTAGSLKL